MTINSSLLFGGEKFLPLSGAPINPATLNNEQEELQHNKRECNLSKTALMMQANLFEASRKGKLWAAKHNLTRVSISLNKVYKLSSAAFFKAGVGNNEYETCIMEKLIWDLAMIFGVEKLFTPTKIIKLHSLSENLRGSIQPALTGCSLEEYLEDSSTIEHKISMKHLIEATIALIVFGMNDTHLRNIFVEDQGNIRFYDNSRSLPSSNNVTEWGINILRSSFTSGLLSLDESYCLLNQEEREFICIEVQKYKSKIKEIDRYFNSLQTRKALQKLPPGWFNAKQSIEAMKERVNRLEIAIKDSKVENLMDITFVVHPDLKFIATTLCLIRKFGGCLKYSEYIKSIFNAQINVIKIKKLLENFKEWKIDPKLIHTRCRTHAKIENIVSKVNKGTQQNQSIIKSSIEELHSYYLSIAKMDYKDVSVMNCELLLFEKLEVVLKRQRKCYYKPYSDAQIKAQLLCEPNRRVYFVGEYTGAFKVAKLFCRLNDKEVWVADIDYLSIPDQYCLGGSAPITPIKLLKYVTNPRPHKFYSLIKASIKGSCERANIPFFSMEVYKALEYLNENRELNFMVIETLPLSDINKPHIKLVYKLKNGQFIIENLDYLSIPGQLMFKRRSLKLFLWNSVANRQNRV